METKLIPALVFEGFYEEDKPINNYFHELLEDSGFQPEIIDSITADKIIDDKIIESLKKVDVVFIILTQRTKTSDGKVLPPFWPIIEAHLSHREGKIMGFFVDEELSGIENLSGILRGIAPLYFNNKKSPYASVKNAKQYTNSIIKSLNDLDNSRKLKYNNFDYIYNKVTKHVYIRQNGHGTISCAFTINPQAKPVSEVIHAFSLGSSADKNTKLPSFSKLYKPANFLNRHTQFSFFFKYMMLPAYRKCTISALKKTPPAGENIETYKAFKIAFNPPIDHNEEPVQYAWGYSSPNMFPINNRQKNKMKVREAFISSYSIMTALTRKYIYNLYFENDYPEKSPFIEYQTAKHVPLCHKQLSCRVGPFYDKYEFQLDEDIQEGADIIARWDIM